MTPDERSFAADGLLLLIAAAAIWRRMRHRHAPLTLQGRAIPKAIPAVTLAIGLAVLLADVLYAYG